MQQNVQSKIILIIKIYFLYRATFCEFLNLNKIYSLLKLFSIAIKMFLMVRYIIFIIAAFLHFGFLGTVGYI